MALNLPRTPSIGQLIRGNRRKWRWSGTSWEIELDPAAPVSETAPENPQDGEMWFNPTEEIAYMWADGQWHDISQKLPSQTSNAGKVLTTDGLSASWSSILTLDAANNIITSEASLAFGDIVADLQASTSAATNLVRPLTLAGSNATMRVWRELDTGDPAFELIYGNDYDGGPGSANNTWWDVVSVQDVLHFRRRTNNANEYPLSVFAGNLVGINKNSTPSYNLEVNGSFAATSITETSSKRYKNNIQPIENALSVVEKLQGVTFNRITTGKLEAGLVAEEVYEELPHVVAKDIYGEIDGVHYPRLVAYLIESVKELKAEIEQLKSTGV